MLVGAFSFFWIGIEDRHLNLVILLAVFISASAALSLLARWELKGTTSVRGRFMQRWCIGTLAGAAISPLAVLLMSIKVGLHDHPVPEFSPADLASVLDRTLIWIVVGCLVGLAGGLIHLADIPRRSG